LLTNLVDQQEDWSAQELLSLYKSQIGIEKNFSFLKDPAIVNSIFLKKAERIEVLGLVLLISLLIWRLMERSMRQYVETNDCTLPGWVRRQTKKPTTFMMTTKFTSVMVITIGRHRQLAKPLKPFQQEYLTALGVTADAFTVSIDARKMHNPCLSRVLNVRSHAQEDSKYRPARRNYLLTPCSAAVTAMQDR
jgi:hypothetical protein